MKLIDFQIIARKILVGLIVFLVPFTILVGGLAIVNLILK